MKKRVFSVQSLESERSDPPVLPHDVTDAREAEPLGPYQGWFFSKSFYDYSFFIFPGLVFFALQEFVFEYLVLTSILVIGFLDFGHLYLTLFRASFEKNNSDIRFLSVLIPSIAFITVLSWLTLQGPFFWQAISYLVCFHVIRQYYGFLCIYFKKNGRYCRPTAIFMAGNMILPFIILHLRADISKEFYNKQSFHIAGGEQWLSLAYLVYLTWVCCWLLHEIYLLAKRRGEWNRLLYTIGVTATFFFCFVTGDHFASIILPIVVTHSLQYYAINFQFMSRKPLLQDKRKITRNMLLCGIAGIGVFLVFYNFFYSYMGESDTTKTPILIAIAISTILSVHIYHYIIDAFLWKRSNKNFSAWIKEEL